MGSAYGRQQTAEQNSSKQQGTRIKVTGNRKKGFGSRAAGIRMPEARNRRTLVRLVGKGTQREIGGACRSVAAKKVAEAAEEKKASGFRHPASSKKNAARKQQTADSKQ